MPISLCNLVNYMWLQQAFFSLVYPSEKDPKLFEMININFKNITIKIKLIYQRKIIINKYFVYQKFLYKV